MRSARTIPCSLLLIVFPCLPARAQVVLNEVLPEPAVGRGEWIEIHNPGSTPVDLSGWWVGDEGDGLDRIIPWVRGGPTSLSPHGFAIVLDPSGLPALLDVPAGILLLRPEDGSIGNGLRADGDLLILGEPAGAPVDSFRWSASPGRGSSLERLSPTGDPPGWRRCRDPSGATPGRVNSWVPLAGDLSVRWREVAGEPIAGVPITLSAIVTDMGEAGLTGLTLTADLRDDSGTPPILLPSVAVVRVPPSDSATVSWVWTPPHGGAWTAGVLVLARGPVPRTWDDADTLRIDVRHGFLSRLVSEAVPRPPAGAPEWIELVDLTGRGEWQGWSVRVRSFGAIGDAARRRSLDGERAPVLLIASSDPAAGPWGAIAVPWIEWSGLRLADAGCWVILLDPLGTPVDSAALRPANAVPRGHAWQRWYPELPGWLPEAWGVSASPADATPGRWEGRAEPSVEFRFIVQHAGDGEVWFEWTGPALRLRMEVRLYALEGREAARPVPGLMVPGTGSLRWRPTVPPGLYVLLVDAHELDGAARWRRRLPVGIRGRTKPPGTS